MRKPFAVIQQWFWPLSALVFGPWHAPLLLSAVSRLTAGTVIGSAIVTHYNTLKSILVVTFSLYFVLAFMIWVVGKRRPANGPGDEPGVTESGQILGLSTKQIIGWGLVGMVIVPVLVSVSVLTHQAYYVATFKQIFSLDPSMNAGFIWLVSISTLIMIPTMVIWLVWMWRAWAKTDRSQPELGSWDYEYE
jgi:hypothetical protein